MRGRFEAGLGRSNPGSVEYEVSNDRACVILSIEEPIECMKTDIRGP
jgi:hypothetical protein